jgi:hypothetical protein
VTVREALAAFGPGPDGASRRGERLLGYAELHVEQGPVLEQRDVPVGVVTPIAGATRAGVRFEGRAGHAGTVLPMELGATRRARSPSSCWRSRRPGARSPGSSRPSGRSLPCRARPT